MINAKLNERIFDVMLQTACEELLDERIAELEAADTGKHEFSPEFERRMKRLFRRQTRWARRKTTRKVLTQAAAVFLVIMSAGFAFTMSVQALRVQFFNTIIEFADKYVGFSFGDSADQPIGEALRPTYLPDGYHESDRQDMQTGIRIAYRNEKGDRIIFKQLQIQEDVNARIDGEHTGNPYNVNISGIDVQVFESNATGYDNYVVWEQSGLFFQIYGAPQPSELIQMARSVIA